MFYTTFTFAAALLNQLAKSRLTATLLKKDSLYISVTSIALVPAALALIHCNRQVTFHSIAVVKYTSHVLL